MVDNWISEIEKLAEIALIEPHVAYSAFVHGYQHKFTFVMRTIPDISGHFKCLDEVITKKLIKNIFNRESSEVERKLFALPVRLGGLGILIPSEMCKIQYKNSIEVTKQLVTQVVNQLEFLELNEKKVKSVKNDIKTEKVRRNAEKLKEIRGMLNGEQIRVLDSVSEAGASNWLNALPLNDYGFLLHKQSFRDALFLRYGIRLKRLPQKCVCGAAFDEIHALNCSRGGFVIIRHNDLRDLTADLLAEVHKDVSVEPKMSELTGEEFVRKSTTTENDARYDVSVRGFWVRGRKAFLDIRVFNPMAKSYTKRSLASVYNMLESSKKNKYNERILNVDHGSFTPLVFSCYGGMGTEAKRFYHQLSEKISEKRNDPISITTNWVRTKISFSLIRSTLLF